ncbi:serine/threonine-protein kinase [Streptomyces tanashiensis]|uniref:Serine/threonine protein kinase n=1 Tax=Streptomyces tanashiensis TaxID=67367 RepID=A0ABY6QUS7_9ACTN|nr:serine/threonine-protein kinase [Streptomyces tanashiensis]UZX20264.1 serine/threonine protein kinase [Streptomyces tanashiensis]
MWDLSKDDPRTIGSFRIVARLGSGGMGTVYLATQEGRDKHVALKTIKSEYAQEEGFRRRFTREATAASSVRSPYTVRVVGFDTQAREPWLATEYVEGLSLREHVQQHGALDLPAAVELALGLSFGLASIHKAGLVHRDLKPGNVLLTDNGPRIIDFGLAYATDFSHATRTESVLGTPGYFSPEQVQGRPVSAASDVFALGAVLTFASSGDHAFPGITPLTAQYHVVHEEPRLSDVHEELRDLIAACMHKDPHERPPLSDILAHLTSLRSYGHKKTAAAFRRSRLAGPRPAAPADEPSTVIPTRTSRSRTGRWAVLAASGALLLATGAAAGRLVSPPTSSATAPNDAPTVEPTVEEPTEEPTTEADPYRSLPGSLSFSPTAKKCVISEGLGLDTASEGFSISVTPVAYRRGWLTEAVIDITNDRGQTADEPPVVHVRLPKGEDISLTMPQGKRTWSFRWPDVLRTAGRDEMPRAYKVMEPRELFGTYTIIIVDYSIMACNGFEGDPRDAAGTSS